MSSLNINQSLVDTAKLLATAAQNLLTIANGNVPAESPKNTPEKTSVQEEFAKEPMFQPRAHQKIDSKTMERALYFLDGGISKREIADKFNLDNFLCYECCTSINRTIDRERGFRCTLTSSDVDRIRFFAKFYLQTTVAHHFNVTPSAIHYHAGYMKGTSGSDSRSEFLTLG